MGKFYLYGVKRLAAEPAVVRTVQIVCRKRVAQISHVHADLMGTPGFQMKLQKRVTVSGIQPFIKGNCRFAVVEIYTSLNYRISKPCNGCGDFSFFRGNSLYHCQIGAADLTAFHLSGEDGGA